jgi:hypothetical protein
MLLGTLIKCGSERIQTMPKHATDRMSNKPITSFRFSQRCVIIHSIIWKPAYLYVEEN